jgi:uncharacterized protein (TIGR03086 family)
MESDAANIFKQVITMAGQAVMKVKPEDLNNPTPCSEWNLRALINHMVYEIAWIPDILDGKSFKETGELHGGDLLGDDVHEAWNEIVIAARTKADETPPDKTVHMYVGDVPAEDYLAEVAYDVLIHGWDVAQAIGEPYEIRGELLVFAKAAVDPLTERYSEYGVFGEMVEVGDDADDQTKILGKMGRSEQWASA